MGLQRIQEDGVQLIVEVALIGEPLRVRRPDCAEVGAPIAVDLLVHQHGLTRRHIHDPQAQVLVGICDALGVGRPGGAIEIAWLGTEVDDRGRLEAGLIVQVELVLAGGVGEVGDGLAVRAPGGVALGYAGGLGQVAGVALLGRDGEDLAVRLEDGARAGGRKLGVLNLLRGNIDSMRRQASQFAVNLNRDWHIHARDRVHQKNAAKLLHDQHRPVRPAYVFCGPGLEGLQIQFAVGHHLRDLLALGVIPIERDRAAVLSRAVAVGEEVDLVADPHRVRVVGVLAGYLFQVEGLEVDDPDGGGLAADVPLPGRLPLGKGLIGE